MFKKIAVGLLGLVMACLPAWAAGPPPGASEQAMSQALAQSNWPADIVQQADAYLDHFPGAPDAESVRGLRDQARQAEAVLARSDIGLYRRAFEVADTAPQLAGDIHRAALGDSVAAWRMSQAHRLGKRGAMRDARLALGWLQYAAALGNDQAAYDLALHYRRQNQPVMASHYEAMAVALNHPIPTSLDHVRK